MPDLTDWAAVLHLCQSVQYLTVSEENALALAQWLALMLAHQRPFVRAWALDAMGRLAAQDRRFEEQFAEALGAAQQDPAASVRARARNLQQ